MSVAGRGKQELYSAAWDAFALEDRATRAPAALESRVRCAVAARVTNRPAHRWSGSGVLQAWHPAAMAVALLGAIGAGSLWPAARRPVERPLPRDIVLLERTPVEAPPSVAIRDVPRVAPRTAPRRARATVPGPSDVEPAVATRLAGGPGEPGERLQMVRLRMPLSELGAVGVRLSDLSRPSQEGGWVDVDVVVGLDGWPRHVLRIASVDPGEL